MGEPFDDGLDPRRQSALVSMNRHAAAVRRQAFVDSPEVEAEHVLELR